MNKEVLVQVGNNRLAVPSFERAGERERESQRGSEKDGDGYHLECERDKRHFHKREKVGWGL